MRADKSALNLQKARQQCSLLPVGEDKQNGNLPLAWAWKAFSKRMPPGSWILNRNLWLMYLGKLGRSLKCLFFFFLGETALWQVTRQGHSGWCETGGTTAQDCIRGAESLGGGDLSSGRRASSSTTLWPLQLHVSTQKASRRRTSHNLHNLRNLDMFY